MLKKIEKKWSLAAALVLSLSLTLGMSSRAAAVDISDYTSFPPFLPRVVSPNILFLMDYSVDMVRPSYGVCAPDAAGGSVDCRVKFFIPLRHQHNSDFQTLTTDSPPQPLKYFGYYNENSRYNCALNGACERADAGVWDGSFLNWLTMTQFDVLKKVTVGGDIDAAPEQGNPTKLYSRIVMPNGYPDKTIVKAMDLTTCGGKSPDCVTWPALPYNDAYFSEVGATVYTGGGDEGRFLIPLPFNFNHYGKSYSAITAQVNGILTFDVTNFPWSTYPYSFYSTPTNIPTKDALNDYLAPFFIDMYMQPFSSVYTKVHGTAPNRVFSITYKNLQFYARMDAASNDGLTFQILLYENSNHIVYQYKDLQYVYGGVNTLYNGANGVTQTKVIVGLEYDGGGYGKLFSRGEAKLAENMAVFASDFVSYQISPGANTKFKTLPPIATSNNTYEVYIDLKQVAKVNNECPPVPASWLNKDRNTCYDHETTGLMQELRDGDIAGVLGFRLGIMYVGGEELNTNPKTVNGGVVKKHFNEKDTTGWPSLMTSTRSADPKAGSTLAESLHMAQGYFRQDTAYNLGLGVANSWTNNGTSAACNATGNNYDPYCFQSAASKVSCAKSYVLMVSSGNYSQDFSRNIYDTTLLAADKVPLASAYRQTAGETALTMNTKAYGGLIDNIAYGMWAPASSPPDLRSDIDGNQNVSIYVVNTFGSAEGDGTNVLKRAAVYGGFKDANLNGAYDKSPEDLNGNCLIDGLEDVNKNGVLDAGEDKNFNGILDWGEDVNHNYKLDGGEDDCSDPRTYFEARDGGDIKAKIISALTDILKNSASGTSVSVLSTSAGGEGALYQAYFYPARIENQKEDRKWPGFLRAFLLDTYQQLRDDYSGTGTPDARLDTSEDRVAKMFLDPTSSEVRINLFNVDGKLPAIDPTPDAVIKMDDVVSMWEGGTQLAKTDKSGRSIYLWHDADMDGVVDNGDFSSIGGETMLLDTSNAATLAPYLRAVSQAEAENIINFTLGAEIPGYRSRCITIPGETQEAGCLSSSQRVWPLGDIIHSTPTLVGAPAEKYNLIYGDKSYFPYYRQYKDRRQVVYVGANDGMLHAFNAGVFNPNDVSFADGPASGDGWTSTIGDELWTFAPRESLPHLGWLACNGTAVDPVACGDSEYTHVYYVDHRPRVSDLRIFNYSGADGSVFPIAGHLGIEGQDGVEHPNGWGTVLIMPLRLGGGAIDVDLNGDGDTLDAGEQSFRSGYYAFDVTDAEKPPKLLWRFSDPGLGFTTSYPAIVRVDSNGTVDGGTIRWFMVVGSGPQNKPPGVGERDYGMTNLTTQPGKVYIIDMTTGAIVHQKTFVGANAIMGDPIAVDINLDFNTDVVYIGSAISTTAGRIFRINTLGNPDPSQWKYSTLYDPLPAAAATPDDPTKFNADPGQNKDMGPLFVSPSVSLDRYGRLWVYFGSGRLKNSTDITNRHQQRFYAIKDACWKSIDEGVCSSDGRNSSNSYAYTLADLFNSSAVQITTASGTSAQVESNGTTSACSGATCSYQQMVTNVQSNYKGWYINLLVPATTASERVLARSSVIGGLILFTTYQPNPDICSIFGNSAMYAVYYETGTAAPNPVVQGDAGIIYGADGKTYVRPKIDLGQGMPTSVGVAIGETVSGFVQKSTGEIIRIEATPALKVRSAITGWRETLDNTGNAGIETIYEHIVK